jgi:small-conductance mechanosensitive channel
LERDSQRLVLVELVLVETERLFRGNAYSAKRERPFRAWDGGSNEQAVYEASYLKVGARRICTDEMRARHEPLQHAYSSTFDSLPMHFHLSPMHIFAVLLVGAIAAGASLLSCPSVLAAPSVTGPDQPPKPSVTVTPAANDTAIANRLRGILESTGWFIAPQVSVRQGIVSLDGATDSLEHQRWAGELAEKTQDVVAVVNRIKVQSDVSSTFGRAGEEISGFYQRAVESWPLVVLSIVILFITWGIAKFVALIARRFFAGRVQSPLLLTVVTRAFSVPVFLLGIYFFLQVAGLTRLALTVLGGTGLAGVIIGFAFRDIAENFLASLLLSARNPFRSGDLVEVAGHTGIVLSLNTRSTVLLTLDGIHIQIPNATVYKSTIKNFSTNPNRRATFTVGIGYESSAAKAQRLISQVLKQHPAVLESPEPLVLVEELGSATVNLRVVYWFDSGIYSPVKINSALLRQTKNALMTGGIELPDPAREIVFPGGVPVTITNASSDAPSKSPVDSERFVPTADEANVSTDSEGDLSSEIEDVSDRVECAVPEAKENLLKN